MHPKTTQTYSITFKRNRQPSRECMGVEPTSACAAQPLTGFEDRGIHRDTSTPSRNDYNSSPCVVKVPPSFWARDLGWGERQPYFNAAISVIMWANAKPD